MSIDYSDMAFPKPVRKKKKKMHKKSILRTKKGICFLCKLLYDDCSEQYTEEHHSCMDPDRGNCPKPMVESISLQSPSQGWIRSGT